MGYHFECGCSFVVELKLAFPGSTLRCPKCRAELRRRESDREVKWPFAAPDAGPPELPKPAVPRRPTFQSRVVGSSLAQAIGAGETPVVAPSVTPADAPERAAAPGEMALEVRPASAVGPLAPMPAPASASTVVGGDGKLAAPAPAPPIPEPPASAPAPSASQRAGGEVTPPPKGAAAPPEPAPEPVAGPAAAPPLPPVAEPEAVPATGPAVGPTAVPLPGPLVAWRVAAALQVVAAGLLLYAAYAATARSSDLRAILSTRASIEARRIAAFDDCRAGNLDGAAGRMAAARQEAASARAAHAGERLFELLDDDLRQAPDRPAVAAGALDPALLPYLLQELPDDDIVRALAGPRRAGFAAACLQDLPTAEISALLGARGTEAALAALEKAPPARRDAAMAGALPILRRDELRAWSAERILEAVPSRAQDLADRLLRD